MEKCYKCGSKQIVKNGKVFGGQRYKCKACGYQFTKNANDNFLLEKLLN